MNETIEENKAYTDKQIEYFDKSTSKQDITIANLMTHINLLNERIGNNTNMIRANNTMLTRLMDK